MWESIIPGVVAVVILVVNSLLGNKKVGAKVDALNQKIGPTFDAVDLAMNIVGELRDSVKDLNISSEESVRLESQIRRLITLAQAKGGVGG